MRDREPAGHLRMMGRGFMIVFVMRLMGLAMNLKPPIRADFVGKNAPTAPQLGQTFCSTRSTQSAQNVHS